MGCSIEHLVNCAGLCNPCWTLAINRTHLEAQIWIGSWCCCVCALWSCLHKRIFIQSTACTVSKYQNFAPYLWAGRGYTQNSYKLARCAVRQAAVDCQQLHRYLSCPSRPDSLWGAPRCYGQLLYSQGVNLTGRPHLGPRLRTCGATLRSVIPLVLVKT